MLDALLATLSNAEWLRRGTRQTDSWLGCAGSRLSAFFTVGWFGIGITMENPIIINEEVRRHRDGAFFADKCGLALSDAAMPHGKHPADRSGVRTMVRPLVYALVALLAPVPASAVVWMENGAFTTLPQTPFTVPFFMLDNTSLDIGTPPITSISLAAQANALFLGQGYQVKTVDFNYADYPPPFSQLFEVATGAPTAGPLALAGQYNMLSDGPGGTIPNGTQYQNAASFPATAPLLPRIAGMLDNTTNGVISFLFTDNINTFSMEILDAGIQKNDGRGGSAQFRFFGRSGDLLGVIPWAKAVDGLVVFRSDKIDIAGVQVTHQDPFGLEYQVLRFGVEVPAPAPIALMAAGLSALGLTRRRRRAGCRERPLTA